MSISRVAFAAALVFSIAQSAQASDPDIPFVSRFLTAGDEITEEIPLSELPKADAKKTAATSTSEAPKPVPGSQDPSSAAGGPQTGAGVVSAADAKCLQASAEGKILAADLSTEDLNEFIAIGKQVWEIVKTGKPVVDVKRDEIAVLPLRVECWRHLEGWSNPVVKAYRTRVKNLYGWTVVDFTYKVISYPGGSYRGTGKYLARVSVVPVATKVAPWWEFNASVRVPGLFNYGTVQDPIASAEIEISYSIRTILTHLDRIDNFLVKGNGELLAL